MKNIALAAFILINISAANAAHYLGGHLDVEITANRELNFRYTDFRILSPNVLGSITVNGPFGNYTLYRNPQLNDTIYLNDCSQLKIKKTVYENTSSFPIPNQLHPPVSGWRFSTNLGCCLTVVNNFSLPLTGFEHIVDVYPIFNTFLQSFILPTGISTFNGHKPNLFRSAFPKINHNFFLGTSPIDPTIDSVSSTLYHPFATNSSSRVIWDTNYSTFSPMPNPSHDSVNAPNTFDSKNAVFSFNVKSPSAQPGFYGYGVRHNHYKFGQRVIRQFQNGLIHLNPIGQGLSPTVEVKSSDTIFTKSDSIFIQKNVKRGDTVRYRFTAKSRNTNQILSTVIVKRLKTPISNGQSGLLNDYSNATFRSLNPTNSAVSNDSSVYEFEWIPGTDNFILDHINQRFEIAFMDSNCANLNVSYVTINITMGEFMKIVVDKEFNLDSIKFCNQSIPLSIIGDDTANAYWSPGHWVNDSTLTNTELIHYDAPGGWLRLYNAFGNARDSIYVMTGLKASKSISRAGNNQLIMRPFNFLYDAKPRWFYNEFVPISSHQFTFSNLLNISGAGNYSIIPKDDTSWICPKYVDTLEIEYSFKWGGNTFPGMTFSDSGSTVFEDYAIEFEIENDTRVLESIYLLGLDTNKTFHTNLVSNPFVSIDAYNNGILTRLGTKNLNYLDGIVQFSFPGIFTIKPGDTIRFEIKTNSYFRYIDGINTPYKVEALKFNTYTKKDINASWISTTSIPILGFEFEGTVGLSENTRSNLRLYPNPVRDILYIDAHFNNVREFQITNLQGQILRRGQLENRQGNLSVRELPQGIYFLHIGEQQARFLKL